MYVHTYVCMCVRVCARACMRRCLHACVCVCVCVTVYTCMHIMYNAVVPFCMRILCTHSWHVYIVSTSTQLQTVARREWHVSWVCTVYAWPAAHSACMLFSHTHTHFFSKDRPWHMCHNNGILKGDTNRQWCQWLCVITPQTFTTRD